MHHAKSKMEGTNLNIYGEELPTGNFRLLGSPFRGPDSAVFAAPSFGERGIRKSDALFWGTKTSVNFTNVKLSPDSVVLITSLVLIYYVFLMGLGMCRAMDLWIMVAVKVLSRKRVLIRRRSNP